MLFLVERVSIFQDLGEKLAPRQTATLLRAFGIVFFDPSHLYLPSKYSDFRIPKLFAPSIKYRLMDADFKRNPAWSIEKSSPPT